MWHTTDVVYCCDKHSDNVPFQEVSALKKLRHKRIVPFYGTTTTVKRGKQATYLNIFMEYMSGVSSL